MDVATAEKSAQEAFLAIQDDICSTLERADGAARFGEDTWQRPGGGGGRSRVLQDGALIEKGGVNFSAVHGELRPEVAAQMPGDGLAFFASGVSLVLHAQNPFVPTVHANFRMLRRGSALWFGGGCDLTPYYPERDDVVHFHRAWKDTCDRHDASFYPRYKAEADRYFYLPHRDETRGVGGIFFDYLQRDLERDLAFVRDCGATFIPAWLPIADRWRGQTFSERERAFQLQRRGRYVEFNLLYDRGTVFGLKTDGRIESILMSLPPLVRWDYAPAYAPGTREADLTRWLKPQEWL